MLCRPIATLILLGLASQVAVAVEPAGRASPYYPYPGGASGGARPASEPGGYSTHAGPQAWGGASPGIDRGGSYAPPTYGTSGGASSRDKPYEQYRFRQRSEDRRVESPDTLRYRPDSDLARRSYQNWGVPGQEWSEGARGPAVIFRPRDQEQPADRKAQPAPAYPEALPQGPGYYPEWPPAYGAPY